MPEPIYLLHIDAYHLDDPLFVPSMARMMARLRRGVPPCLLVHGSGEQAERLLEAEGLFPEPGRGRTPREAVLVERALRLVNRRLVGTMTDEGVHAVGFQGVDRGLLRVDGEGMVATGKTGWLEDLVRLGAVPVVSTLVRGAPEGSVHEADLAGVTLALARSLAVEKVVVVFFTRSGQPGLLHGEGVRVDCSLETVPADAVPAAAALQIVARAGCRVWITSPAGLFGDEIPRGTKIFTSKTAQKA